jgi:hypothetical protein
MICYKDRTYCTAIGDKCANDRCDRAFTNGVEASAAAFGLPVALSDLWEVCSIRIPKLN